MSKVKKLRALRARVREDREQAFDVALELAGQAHNNGDAAELELALTRTEQLDERLNRLSRIEIREPDIYERGNDDASFFRDLVASTGADVPRHWPKQSVAQERLQKHSDFEWARVPIASERASRALALHGIHARAADGFQSRALSSTAGAGGELLPPAWIVDQFASVSRAGCALRELVTKLDLPDNTLELHIPRFDTAAGVVPMQAENTNPPDEYSTSDGLVSKVATFAGDGLVSQQLHERGGHFSDEVVVQDSGEAYGAALAQQLMNGTGLNGQLLGLLNVPAGTVNGVPGARTVTYTSASPTPSDLIKNIASGAGQISDVRERPPSVALMRGARWFWIAGTPPDGTAGNEPTQRPGGGGLPPDAKSDLGPYGPVASLPAYHDNTIPANLGGGGNQDVVVLARARDILLLEDPAGPRFSAFIEGGTSGELSVVLQWHTYTAAVVNRYPSGICVVQGTGLVVPANF